MTPAEDRAQFSLWAIMASPLILGNDMTQMSADTLATVSNPEVIAVDHDAAGVQGTPISASTSLEVWAKRLAAPHTVAVVLFNRTGAPAPITVSWSSLGLKGPAAVRDLWARKDLGTIPSGYTATVPSHSVVMLRITGS